MRLGSLLLFGCSGGSPPAESGDGDDSVSDDSAVDSRAPIYSDDSDTPDSNPPDSGDSSTPVPEGCTATPGAYCAACDAEVVIECPDDDFFAGWGLRVGATDAGAWLVTGAADRGYVFDVDPDGATPRDGVPPSFAKSATFAVEDPTGALHLAASDADWRIHYGRPGEKGWTVESLPDDDTYLRGMTTDDGLPVLWFTDTDGKMHFARLSPKVSTGDAAMPDAYDIDWVDLTLDTNGVLVAGGFDERKDYSAVGLFGGEVTSLASWGSSFQRPWAFARLPPSGSVEGSRLGVAVMDGGLAVSFFDPELSSTTVVETSELTPERPDPGDEKPCPDDCHVESTGPYSAPQFVAARDESGAVWVAYVHAHFDFDYHYEWEDTGTHHDHWSSCWSEVVNDESTFSYEVVRVDEKGTARPVLSIPLEFGMIPSPYSVTGYNSGISFSWILSIRNGRGVFAATFRLVDENLVHVMMFDAE